MDNFQFNNFKYFMARTEDARVASSETKHGINKIDMQWTDGFCCTPKEKEENLIILLLQTLKNL
jgi:hypothetical protein